MNRRRLLFLTRNPEQRAVTAALSAAGWDVDTVCDTADAQKSVRSGDYQVGAIVLSGAKEDEWLLANRPLRKDRAIQWVVIASPEILHRTRYREFILEYCYDYHTLPLCAERLTVTLGHASGMAMLMAGSLATDVGEDKWAELGLLGASAPLQALFRRAEKIAGSEFPVLITGESGTGKEKLAAAIHQMSSRSARQFVPVNCATLPKTLIQSELFGNERAAFTGADRRRLGRIEVAQGGTILLDEIGDLPLDAQGNLLRFLQESTIQRVGGTEHIHVDVRVLAATHVDLEEAVRRGDFREDLYYRLNVIPLKMPALRERPGDVELIARHFFDQFRRLEGAGPAQAFSRAALGALCEHHWGGNVRELMNRVRRAVLLCEGRLISPADLELREVSEAIPATTLTEAREAAEQQVIRRTLERARGNVSSAARSLQVSRVYLYDLMAKYELSRSSA